MPSAQEFHPDGSITDRTHQIVHVLDQRGVDKYGEARLPPGAEILAAPDAEAGRAAPWSRTAAGRRAPSPSPGWSRVTTSRWSSCASSRGAIDGHAADTFFFQNEGERLVRSTYAVVAPAALGLEVDAHRLAPPPLERSGERVTMRVTRTQVPGLVAEPGAPQLREVLPFVQLGYGEGRDVLQRRVADALAARARPTVELEAFAREIRAAAGGGAGEEALARAAWTRVATQILGAGGSLGSDAAEVLSRGRGSRTVLMKAVLDLLGVEARLALVRPFDADPAPYRFPGLSLYGHTLLRIRADGRELWVDPDERDAPFGSLPAATLDAEAMMLPAPGEPLEVARTPARAAVPSARRSTLRVSARRERRRGRRGDGPLRRRGLGGHPRRARAVRRRPAPPDLRAVADGQLQGRLAGGARAPRAGGPRGGAGGGVSARAPPRLAGAKGTGCSSRRRSSR